MWLQLMLEGWPLHHVVFVHVLVAHHVVQIVVQFFVGVIQTAATAASGRAGRAAARG